MNVNVKNAVTGHWKRHIAEVVSVVVAAYGGIIGFVVGDTVYPSEGLVAGGVAGTVFFILIYESVKTRLLGGNSAWVDRVSIRNGLLSVVAVGFTMAALALYLFLADVLWCLSSSSVLWINAAIISFGVVAWIGYHLSRSLFGAVEQQLRRRYGEGGLFTEGSA